jgi:RNA polymerase sigma-70 factor, ECF subfamily
LVGDEDVAMIADPIDEIHQRQAAAAGLHSFMQLSAAQRSSVILKDVLGYSLEEIGDITGGSIAAVKGALHRGREGLHAAVQQPDDRPVPILGAAERAKLSAYVAHFNARDFDTVRNMLADDVRLELVNKTRLKGRTEVERYFGNYARLHDWGFQLGFIDRRPAIVATDPSDPARAPRYFVLLHWTRDRIDVIRDFRHASYVMDAAEIVVPE